MTASKKRVLVFGALVVSLLLSVSLSVVRFSYVNISNILEERTSISMTAEGNWSSHGQGSVSFAPGQGMFTVQCDSPIFVRNVLLGGVFPQNRESVTVSYRSSADGHGEWKERVLPLAVKNDDLYFEVNDDVSVMRVTIGQDGGDGGFEIREVTLNPTKLNVNYLLLLLSFFLPLSLLLLLIEIGYDKAGYSKMSVSLVKYRCLLVDLVSRDLKTKYRRSILGILWSVLNPLLMMLVLTAIFSNIVRFDIQDFPVYYLTGYILFNFVSEATNFSMVSIIGATGLIKKVYIPKILFPLEKCLFSLVNFSFSLIAAVIVFLIVGVTPSRTMLLFFVPVLYLLVFNLGLGLILATVNTFFRDVGYLYNVFVTLWMYLTPIIYPITALPDWMQGIVRVNPLYHYVEYFRAVTLYDTLPTLGDNLICLTYSLIFLFLGVTVFQKKQNKFIFYV